MRHIFSSLFCSAFTARATSMAQSLSDEDRGRLETTLGGNDVTRDSMSEIAKKISSNISGLFVDTGSLSVGDTGDRSVA